MANRQRQLAPAPLPHSKHCLLRQGMADLAGEHGNLSAMVRVVRNQVTEESGHIGTKVLDSTVARPHTHIHARPLPDSQYYARVAAEFFRLRLPSATSHAHCACEPQSQRWCGPCLL